MKRQDFWILNTSSNNEIKINVNILTHALLCNSFDFFEDKWAVCKGEAKAKAREKWKLRLTLKQEKSEKKKKEREKKK